MHARAEVKGAGGSRFHVDAYFGDVPEAAAHVHDAVVVRAQPNVGAGPAANVSQVVDVVRDFLERGAHLKRGCRAAAASGTQQILISIYTYIYIGREREIERLKQFSRVCGGARS
jgi:hypothetical protein